MTENSNGDGGWEIGGEWNAMISQRKLVKKDQSSAAGHSVQVEMTGLEL